MALRQFVRSQLSSVGSLAGRLGVARRTPTLQFIPKDPRTADPSFARELASGYLGLAGRVVDLGGRSPFAITHADDAWTSELMAFGWLRHVSASREDPDRARARRLVVDFLDSRPGGLAWRPDVAGRRLVAWLCCAGSLIDGADEAFYTKFIRGLADGIDALDRICRSDRGIPERITAAAALALGALVFGERDGQLARAEHVLSEEIRGQFRADGSHSSRNAGLVLALLVDLLPLRASYLAGRRAPLEPLVRTTDAMTDFLRLMRLGDGSLARFHGTGRVDADLLATILAITPAGPAVEPAIGPSGYARLEQGGTVVIADCAPPPAGSGTAMAGALAFEMSVGGERLVRNGGWAHGGDPVMAALARATASHSTLSLAATSSSEPERKSDWTAYSPLSPSGPVAGQLSQRDGRLVLDAEHGGYVGRFGVLHRRQLTLAADGLKLEVEDRLVAPSGDVRLERDLPFAIHVHLPTDAEAQTSLAGDAATITLFSGTRWRLAVEGARASIEPSRDFAHALGVVTTRQIALRATTAGETRVRWSLTADRDAPAVT